LTTRKEPANISGEAKRVKPKKRRKTKKVKWRKLENAGVLFPPEYEFRNLSLLIKGEKINLSPEQEERAWAWANKRDTPYILDEVFASNFLSDFKKILPKKYSDLKMSDLDFSDIIRIQENEKIRKSHPKIIKELAAKRKIIREKLKEKYGYIKIDGHKTEVANYLVEPPGIFMGRGKHPFRGKWKPRIYPKDVTLNLSSGSPKPMGEWGKIVHDRHSIWLASWVDRLTKNIKYVWPHDSSRIRQSRDIAKYDHAKKLQSKLKKIRTFILKGMSSKDEKTRKIASVCYLIDKLCMRVGDEKDEDEADTVGASTLRVEHTKLNTQTIQFDFLGKDSVPWSKIITVKDEDDLLFKKNLGGFMIGKNESDPIFDGVRSSDVNRFLGCSAKGLTAKVFRTFHASNIIRKYLSKKKKMQDNGDYLKLYQAKLANLEAAKTCNHKRTPPKTWEKSLAKKRERLKKIKSKPPKTKKGKSRYGERIEKARIAIRMAKATKEYNLNTSLRNYIDPRIYKSWSDTIDLDWRKIYPKTLQKKFSWVEESS
jgi:DNA topoisomerase-1